MGKINIDIKSGSLSNQGLAVGIDLGTTNSLVAWVEPTNQQVEVFPINEGRTLYPSLVHFSHTGDRYTGSEAQVAQQDHPDQVIYSVKRLIGMSQADYLLAKEQYGYLIHSRFGSSGVELSDPAGHWHSAIDISSYILSAITKKAASLKQEKVSRAVVTVPAYFDESQRAATKLAGEKAGLEVLRIINEPTAACLAFGYGDRSEKTRHLVVYDLGGGTFDVSVVRVESGVFEVLSTHGDTQLGGDDIDRSILLHWQQHNPRSTDVSHPSSSLRLLAKRAKEELGKVDPFVQNVEGVEFMLLRSELERLAAPWVDRTLVSCEQALEDAGLTLSDIDDVLMVGGSTRMPYIKQRISAFFGRPVNDQINPDEVVAIGAALQAAQLNGTEMGHLLLDVTPLSLGIETSGGLMDVLIPRNAKIPTRVSRQYTTQRDGQTSIRISVYQGERDLIQHNRELSRFHVSGIPAMPAGMPKLNVTFQIDANGLLRVEARELRSGIHQEVIVNPAENLTKDQIDQRLEEAFSHAEADKETRARIQLVEEAGALVANLRKLLSANRDWIEPPVYDAFMSDCLLLENTIQKEDAVIIKDRMDGLESKARPLAEEAMNRAVGNHLRNSSV